MAPRLEYTLASRGSGSAAAIARYSAALSTSSCQFSRYRGMSSRSLMSLILIQPDSSRGTVTVHEPLIQDLLLGAAAVVGSRRYRAILEEDATRPPRAVGGHGGAQPRWREK